MAKYRIYEDDMHHLGIISEDRSYKTPAVYDEIQIKEDGVWFCRAYVNWDYFYTKTGGFSVKSRENTHYYVTYGKGVNPNKKPISVEDRKVYDSITVHETGKFITTYDKGKFGVKRLDGSIVLDALYDDVSIWKDANVIQARLGNSYMYFNDQRVQILTDKPSCHEKDGPYFWDGMGWHNFMTREMVDEISDGQTYESPIGLIRINQQGVTDVAQMLQENCQRILMNPNAITELTDQYSYEFGMTTIRLQANQNGEIIPEEWLKGIENLETLGAFENSWHYIDKFLSNTRTKLSVKSLYWLKHRYDMEYDVLGRLCFSYGIDDTLADGEVKWIHVEHYNEHCFPNDYGVSNVMNRGTLSELKNLIASHDWKAQGDPYGGCFFGYRNIRYSEDRPWEETESILEYMYDLGHRPENLIKCLVAELHYCSTFSTEEMDFWEKCAYWALNKCDFPNDISCGETFYDKFLAYTGNYTETNEHQDKIDCLCEFFRNHGARTCQQQTGYYNQQIQHLQDAYDYSIMATW